MLRNMLKYTVELHPTAMENPLPYNTRIHREKPVPAHVTAPQLNSLSDLLLPHSCSCPVPSTVIHTAADCAVGQIGACHFSAESTPAARHLVQEDTWLPPACTSAHSPTPVLSSVSQLPALLLGSPAAILASGCSLDPPSMFSSGGLCSHPSVRASSSRSLQSFPHRL